MARYLTPILIGVLGTVVLIWLGTWQLQRLTWKEDVIAEISARLDADPMPLPAEITEAQHRFLPVAVSGTADVDDTIPVFASIKDQGVRMRLIQPLNTLDGRRILLERGLVRPEDLDALDLSADITVSGALHWPDEADLFTPDPDPINGQWYARDVNAMALALDTEPVLVVASHVIPGDGAVTPFPLDPSGIPNNHLEYVITWYGLAVVWVGMTLYWIRRIARHRYLYGDR